MTAIAEASITTAKSFWAL